MIDNNIISVPKSAEDEVPFVAFKTPFAQKICAIAGVKNLMDLLGMKVSIYDESGGTISTIVEVNHCKKEDEESEVIYLSLSANKYPELEITLFEDNKHSSGVYNFLSENSEHAKLTVRIGPNENLLCGDSGYIA